MKLVPFLRFVSLPCLFSPFVQASFLLQKTWTRTFPFSKSCSIQEQTHRHFHDSAHLRIRLPFYIPTPPTFLSLPSQTQSQSQSQSYDTENNPPHLSSTSSSPTTSVEDSLHRPLVTTDGTNHNITNHLPHDHNNKHRPTLIESIHSIEQFLAFIDRPPSHSLRVVKFHANYCTTCKRVVMKYKKIAYKYHHHVKNNTEHDNSYEHKLHLQSSHERGQTEERQPPTQTPPTTPQVPVEFADVEVTANEVLASTLGVQQYPFLHIYRNGQCVASFGTGPPENFVTMVESTIEQERAMTEEDWVWFYQQFQAHIQEGTNKIHSLRNLVHDQSVIVPQDVREKEMERK